MKRLNSILVLVLASLAVRALHAEEAPDVKAGVAASGLVSGLAVAVGGDGAVETEILRAGPDWILLSVGGEVAAADARREKLRSHAGSAVVQPLLSSEIPVYARAAALLVIDADALGSAAPSDAEIARVLRPFCTAWVKRGGRWASRRGQWPETIADYPHWLGDAGMSAQVRDEEAGPVRSLRWVTQGRKQSNADSMVWMAGGVLVSNHPDRSEVKESNLSGYDAFTGLRLWRRPDLSPGAGYPTTGADYHYGVALDRQRLVVPGLDASAVMASIPPDAPPWAMAHAIGQNRKKSWAQGTPEYLLALDSKTGKTLLTYDQGPDQLKDGEITALLHAGRLIAVAGGGLWVLDAATGKRIWHVRREDAQLLFPSAQGDQLVVAVGERVGATRAHGNMLDREFTLREVVAHDLADGGLRWRWHYERDPALSDRHRCTLVAHNAGRLWVSVRADPPKGNVRDASELICLDPAMGRPIWRIRHAELGPTDNFTRLAVIGERVFMSHGADTLAVFSLADGRPLTQGRSYQGACLTARASRNHVFHSAVTIGGEPPFPVHRAHPVAGRCHLGAFPGHGMLLSAGARCDCDPFLYGISAFGSDLPPQTVDPITVTGPGQPASMVEGDAWRTALRDARRSGWSDTSLAGELQSRWSIRLDVLPPASQVLAQQWDLHPTAEWISAPVVADGVVTVSLPHRHQVVSLDPATGAERWRHVAGGRVDGPPTLAGGMVVFGTAAGWIEAVSLADGRPVWRSLVAPGTRFRVDNAQVESSHGIPAAVTVVGDRVYAMGGSHSHLDGGLRWAELDLPTGRVLRHGFTPTTPEPFEFRSADGKRPGKGFPIEVDDYPLVNPFKQDTFQRLPGTFPSTHLAVAYPEVRCGILTLTPEGWLALGKLALDPKSGAILKAGRDFGYVDSGHWGNDLKSAPRYPVAMQAGLLGKGPDQVTLGGVKAKQIAYRGNEFVALACTAPGDYAARNLVRLLARCELPDDGSGKAKVVWEVPWEGGRRLELQSLMSAPPALAVAGDAVLIGWDKQLRRYRLSDGSLQATLDLPAPLTQAGIAVAEGAVYVTCQDGTVMALR